MKSLWDEDQATLLADDRLALRVYTSRLLGAEPSLVLHGGGNTSVKADAANLFGETERILFVKGSGWNLATIEQAGFAPVRLDVLKKMAQLEALSDSDMVNAQRAAMINPNAPNPSVEAILHAIIPFAFVDHTHADAVVTISNTADGGARLHDIYGDDVLILPYIMPGFVLAKQVHEMTVSINWETLKGIVLLHHGVFTFADNARESYENMIDLVTQAEAYLAAHAVLSPVTQVDTALDLKQLAAIRRSVSQVRGTPILAQLNSDADAVDFSARKDVCDITARGPLTPDHVIRTKRTAMIIDDEVIDSVAAFAADYREYFKRHNGGSLTCLDPAPRWALWPGRGALSFGTTPGECNTIADISRHTMQAIACAELLGGWQALPEEDIFNLEYWELEQAKLKKNEVVPEFRGKVALVTGAASGIGAACVEALLARGTVVAAIDVNTDIREKFPADRTLGMVCDMNDPVAVREAVETCVRHFGGLDIVVSNAGIFPSSSRIEQMDAEIWQQSMNLNLTSHQRLMQETIPYLKLGLDPAIVVIASKNVPAPGPGAAAYSVAKAGLTQLVRVAALELGGDGIRVNVLHPNAVFDTAIWTDDVLEKRAASYGQSVQEYKTNNVLNCEVKSHHVA
ncbi:MAG: bifunctional aldolase/short-chain dehydrogenase, partial [Mariprofundus sp.]|nr:bifunctional aldolase/short-chain dehydrogenase [Mariprofundus sp.]